MDNSCCLILDQEGRYMKDLLLHPFLYILLWANYSEGGKNTFYYFFFFFLHYIRQTVLIKG